jgi:hypothetical protein
MLLMAGLEAAGNLLSKPVDADGLYQLRLGGVDIKREKRARGDGLVVGEFD